MKHHAFLFLNSRWKSQNFDIKNLIEKIGVNKADNILSSDIYSIERDNLSVDDAREIKNQSYISASVAQSNRIFVIKFQAITHEAQNALLKILEEPPENVIFLIFVEYFFDLLPTIKSRVQILEISGYIERKIDEKSKSDFQEIEKLAKSFISSKTPKRIKICNDLIDKYSEDNRELIQYFIISLINLSRNDADHKSRDFNLLKNCDLCLKYLNYRSASVKQIMEYLSLS